MTNPATIGVVGATGVLGRHVVPRLLECGYRVRALARDPASAPWLQVPGVQIRRADLLEAASLPVPLDGCDTVLHLATSIPKVDTQTGWCMNDRIRREGTRHLLDACRQVGVTGYVQQSIAMLQAREDGAWTDEDSPVKPTTRTASAADMEDAVRGSRLEWCILRGGYFYGPGTRSDQWLRQARGGTLALPGDGRRYLSLIHVSDMAAAVVRAVIRRPRDALLCVVDDEPVTYAELFNYLALIAGAPSPKPGGATSVPSFRVSNQRIRRMSGWIPHYPSYRSGLAAVQ